MTDLSIGIAQFSCSAYIPTANAPIRIDVQEGQNQVATESRQRLKRGRPIGSKDKNPQKSKKGAENETEVVKTLDATAAVPKSRDLAATDPKTLIAIAADHECLDAAGPDVSNTDSLDAKIQGTAGPDNNELSIKYVLPGI